MRLILLPFIFPAREILSPFFCGFHRGIQIIDIPCSGSQTLEFFKEFFEKPGLVPNLETVVNSHLCRKAWRHLFPTDARMQFVEYRIQNFPVAAARSSPLLFRN